MAADFPELMDEGARHVAECAWGEAAEVYARAAHFAGMRGRVPDAWRAWRAAGECWRRDDQPREAERCLRRAFELTEPGGEAAELTAPVLAGVLGDLGEAEAAEDLLESVAAEHGSRTPAPTFIDTRLGLLLQLGRKEAARVLLASLEDGAGPARLAWRMRTAQLQTIDGELARARTGWRRLGVELGRDELTAPGVPAALIGLAEVLVLLGEEREALEHFQVAAEGAREVGRHSLAWRAEAGRVRAMVDLGVQPMPGMLDAGVAFAEGRGLRPLEASLRLARGLSTVEHAPERAEEDLSLAMDLAMQAGLTVLVGRAAYARALRLPGADPQRRHLLDTAAMAVVSHVPLAARVALARARLLARFDPLQARSVARACLPRLERMGMTRDLLAARALVRQLG